MKILVRMIFASLVFGAAAIAMAQSPGNQETAVIRPQPRSEFDLQVFVDGRPLTEYFARGRTYIEALEGAEYELRIHNPLPERVAVALSVDGLNTIDARHTSAWNASKWVIEPYGTITIGGWQMSSERARRFYFTTERDSYAAKLGQTTNLGVISAVVFRERRHYPMPVVPPSQSRRDDQREQQSGGVSKSQRADASKAPRSEAVIADDDYAATGIGRSVRNAVTWIQMDLESQPAAEMSIRYEFYSALLKLGIVPRSYSENYPLRRRENSRGFSPEPR
ncbi:MAG: hypothetical protein C5B55_10595 [Blastocatellia bacterium]|nr:MAG: hypothetical protein C5B55_10595 [Blastocatellia bacterium]